MNTKILVALLFLSPGLPTFAGTLLFSDNFNAPDGPLDSAPTAGRLSGIASGETALQSFGASQNIANNQLDTSGFGRGGVRFGGEFARYDWAGLTTGPDILAAGGFTVSFDWTYFDGASPDWIAWKVGTPNNDSPVNASDVNYGILVRENGANEIWQNGTSLGDTGLGFTPVVGTPIPVSFTFLFDSFANGSMVSVTGMVNGTQILNSTFDWSGHDGQLFMELQVEDPFFVDNLAISSVPEPGTTMLLAGAGMAALLMERRFRKRI